jgi:hypothetical protein
MRSKRRARSWAGKAAVVVAAGTLLPLAAIAPALANAPNPNPDIKAMETVNGNGTVTVKLSGTWSWPGQNCEGRYGEGWAVDWWGISSSQTPTKSFTITNASVVTGVPGVESQGGTLTPTGAIQIPNDGYFHYGQYYSGQDVNSAGTCTDTTINGQQGSTGSWSATGTYPNKSDLPPQICVNMYDEHGSEGKPSNSPQDYSPTDSDNSIQTNAFNPTVGQGYCAVPKKVPPPPKPGITLLKQICNKQATNCTSSASADWTHAHEVKSGATAVWKLTVTDTGDTKLTGIKIIDAKVPSCAGTTSPSSLKAGQSLTVVCDSTDVTKGFTNVAKVTGAPPSGATVTSKPATAVVTVIKPKPPKLITSQTLTPNDEAFIGQEATGSVTFSLYRPDNADCSGSPDFSQTVTVASSGTAQTTNTSFVATEAGEWRWLVTYTGNDGTLTSSCGAENFTIVNG